MELRLHASRDFAYAIIIGSLGFVTWHGVLAWVLLGVQLAVGNTLLLKAGRTGPGTVKFHHRTMLAIVTLTTLHVLLTGISLHSIFRAS